VVVIGNAPLLGFGLPLNRCRRMSRPQTSQDMKRAQTTDVADYLNRKLQRRQRE